MSAGEVTTNCIHVEQLLQALWHVADALEQTVDFIGGVASDGSATDCCVMPNINYNVVHL